MYDINKLHELASMFNVEVSLYGEDQDKLQMIGTNGDINKFFEEAKRQGLLGKDPFDESYKVVDEKGNKVEQGGGFSSKNEAELFAAQYGQEGLKVVRESLNENNIAKNIQYNDTSWIDDLRDAFTEFEHFLWSEPSYEAIKNKYSLFIPLLEEYFKNFPQDEFILKEETLMERMDFETLYKKVKEQDRPIQEGFFGTLLFDTSFAHELYDEFYKPLTDLIKKGDKEAALKEYNELAAEVEELANKKYAKTFVVVQRNRLAEYKDQIDAMEDAKVEEPALVEDMISNTRSITIEGVQEREECPYLLGEDSAECEIANRLDLTEDELWCTGWVGVVQNVNNSPFKSFDELDIYCYDTEKGNEYHLPEIPEDIKAKFLAEVNKYMNEVGTNSNSPQASNTPNNQTVIPPLKGIDEYKPHTQRILKVLNGEKLDDDSMNDLDDYEESYTPILEDIDDEYEVPSYKAENVEFVMTEYISDSAGVESVNKVNDTTYKVLYDGTEVEIVFDFGWDEWVYTINGKGPFSHGSYEWLISDIGTVLAQEPIQESYFEDEPSWLDDEDPVDVDREHTNLYGGDRTYCDTCGSKLAMDEWGGYCPKCNAEEKALDDLYHDASEDELRNMGAFDNLHEAFPTHSDIDLDMVGVRVANLLDVEALGEDNWIEFDCKDARTLLDTPDLHMAFEAVGSNKMIRGFMRAHTDGTIDVYITNGSEGKFRNPEEIARFIAGEFGISI